MSRIRLVGGSNDSGNDVGVGSDADFDNYVRTHRHALLRYATLISGSTALGEDLVQNVLARLYPRWGTVRAGAGDLPAYLRRAVTNEYLSWLRRWHTRHLVLVDHQALHHLASAAPGDHTADGPDPQLWARLQGLPARQRTALVLRYFQDLTDAEIADAMSCREGTVRAHVSRGLSALRGQLTDQGDTRD